MISTSKLTLATALALGAVTLPAQAQDNALSFSLTGGAQISPKYFGSSEYRVGPSGAFGFTGLRFGAAQLGDPEGPAQFAPGAGLRGAFRFIPKRKGESELAGMEDVKTSVELGIGAHYTQEFWQVFGDIRYGVIGHKAIAGEIGANLIWRDPSGLVLHGGPRAEFGNSRFNRTYFGVTPAEAADPGNTLTPYTLSGGFHSVGLEIGAYQPLNADWGITAALRYDRLRGAAARSPIVQQGSRNQFGAEIGLTRHFNLRF
ncbi:MipA/OmpV family protein [Natronohydrobacter thiooxidans]|jgi:outer membrane protein|uniref:MipA/OmpV family protein n=1 Tax=Natronohydrobacter thiooxidans TaxID=87172 RepID=UPI0008FF63F3|nr:MipA/OmpV family protein [Natronohydrobacter thiooxidans]